MDNQAQDSELLNEVLRITEHGSARSMSTYGPGHQDGT